MPYTGKGIWGRIIKGPAKNATQSTADRAIGMLDDIWLKGKLKIGDYTPEQARRADADIADYTHENRTAAHVAAGDDFDKAIKERFNQLDDTAHERCITSGLDDAITQRFDNAKAAGKDTRAAIDEVAEYLRKKSGYDEYDFSADIEEELKRTGRL